MSDQPLRPRFFVTAESPCSYLPGRTERKVFAELRGENAAQTSETLGRIGFRRSQNVVYRPSCHGCTACVSVRVRAADFVPSRSQAKALRRNGDLDVTACQAWATQEQFELMQHYLQARHPEGGMATMDSYDFADMVEASPVDTLVVEYRLPASSDDPGRLVGVSLTDRQSDGLSMIYSFFATDLYDRPGLGTYIILEHIRRAAAGGLAYVYLGYWVQGSPRMDYKRSFAPLENLTADGWRPFSAETAAAPPTRPASMFAGAFGRFR
jgi:leucyl-tRNA---protein transferase